MQVIAPQPSPETWVADLVPFNGEQILELKIFHVGGVHHSYFHLDGAEELFTLILGKIKTGKTGLILPGQFSIVPNGHQH